MLVYQLSTNIKHLIHPAGMCALKYSTEPEPFSRSLRHISCFLSALTEYVASCLEEQEFILGYGLRVLHHDRED